MATVTEKFTNWRKSTRSTNSAGNCVEVAFAGWRKSSRSGSTTGNCVEVAFADTRVGVRDSKAGGVGPVLEFRGGEWAAFMGAVRTGSFDIG
jgi:uncharacterized protein DUF397